MEAQIRRTFELLGRSLELSATSIVQKRPRGLNGSTHTKRAVGPDDRWIGRPAKNFECASSPPRPHRKPYRVQSGSTNVALIVHGASVTLPKAFNTFLLSFIAIAFLVIVTDSTFISFDFQVREKQHWHTPRSTTYILFFPDGL